MTTLRAKDPNTDTEYAIDARQAVIGTARREWPYALGSIVKAQRHTGFYYEATTAGETKAHWPTFPVESDETLQDGSVIWTCKHPDDASLPTLSSVTWTISPTGELAVASQRLEGGIVYPTFEDGIVDVEYEVTAHITWSTGQEDDVTVTIPVAQL